MSHDICMCETSIIHFVIMVSEQVNNTIATFCCICLHAAFQIVVHGLDQVNDTFVTSLIVLLSSASACPHCSHVARLQTGHTCVKACARIAIVDGAQNPAQGETSIGCPLGCC